MTRRTPQPAINGAYKLLILLLLLLPMCRWRRKAKLQSPTPISNLHRWCRKANSNLKLQSQAPISNLHRWCRKANGSRPVPLGA